MNEQCTIRPYQVADKAPLLELLSLLIPTYFAPEELEDFRFYLDNEIELYYVAERNGKIVAAAGINFEKEKGIGKLSWDFVHPEEHGKGLGSLLSNYRIDILLAMEEITAITVRTSQLAFRFYEKCGFETIDIQKDYWAPGFDLYQMVYRKASDLVQQ